MMATRRKQKQPRQTKRKQKPVVTQGGLDAATIKHLDNLIISQHERQQEARNYGNIKAQ